MKFIATLICSLVIISIVQCQVLNNNRYDYQNLTSIQLINGTKLSSQVVIFACGLSSTQLSILNSTFSSKLLSSQQYSNFNTYVGCSNSSQTLTQFIVSSSNLASLRSTLLAKNGLRQQISCIDEIMLRSYLNNQFGKINYNSIDDYGPQLVRLIFHDALDYNNTVNALNQSLQVSAGLDFCLYSTYQFNTTSVYNTDADGGHNINMDQAMNYVVNNFNYVNQWLDYPDIEALGSFVAVESWHQGPKIPAYLGRSRGNCSAFICANFYKSQNTTLYTKCYNQTVFLKSKPSATDWSPKNNLNVFQTLGLSNKQAISLLGAHTLGGIINWKVTNPGTNDLCSTPNSSLTYTSINGTYFDQTPYVFDNNYFQLLNDMSGAVQNQLSFPSCAYSDKIQAANSTYFNSTICPTATYCNDTNNNIPHMRNMINYTTYNGAYKRIGHTGSDWNALLDSELQMYVKGFASNQTDFFSTFSAAFSQLANLGYSNSALFQCSTVSCNFNSDKTLFQCSNTVGDALNFAVNGVSTCMTSGDEQSCNLVGGNGVQGQIQCDLDIIYSCPINNDSQYTLSQSNLLANNYVVRGPK